MLALWNLLSCRQVAAISQSTRLFELRALAEGYVQAEFGDTRTLGRETDCDRSKKAIRGFRNATHHTAPIQGSADLLPQEKRAAHDRDLALRSKFVHIRCDIASREYDN